MNDDQLTDLERLTLSRRRFIGAGALTGAALFLGGGLLSRSVLADSISASVPSPCLLYTSPSPRD